MAATTQVMLEPVLETLDRSSSSPQPIQHRGHDNDNSAASIASAASATSGENSFQFPKLRKAIVVTQLAGVNFTSSAVNGLTVVALPAIITDLTLAPSLSFWPVSVSSLATAASLLLAGSFADVVGPRTVDLVGCFANGALMIGAGTSRNGPEFIPLRALQGVAVALHFSASVPIVTQVLPRGKGRNLAFGILGLSQVLGFSFGLVVGGVLVDTIGWRSGWFISGGITLLLSTAAVWALPQNHHDTSIKGMLQRLTEKIDWVGATLASVFMALLCYLFAILSTDVNNIREPKNIALLCLGVGAGPCFVAWVHRQERLGRPALIPNRLWANPAFSGICVTIALSYAVCNSLEVFASLFFQQVQNLSAIQASIRILPSMTVGMIMNLTAGLLVDKVPPLLIVTISSALCAGSPLLMAVIQPEWSYWADAFIAQVLQPVSADAMFTLSLLVISDVFPDDTQGLAGGVFNTAAQFGTALGLAVMQIISAQVTKGHEDMEKSKALMEGYRASFWTMFGFMVVCGIVGGLCLRKSGRVGLKRD